MRNPENTPNTPPPKEDKIDTLMRAFELFCQETGRLEGAYSNLKKDFQEANVELAETNQKLSLKVKELGQLTSYLETILTHISQGLIFIDLSGKITLFNPAAYQIFSPSSPEVVGKNFLDLFPDTLFGFSLTRALEAQKAPHFTRLSYSPGPDENEKLLDIEANLLLNPEEATGLIVTVRDITELKRLELLTQRNDRMKELGLLAAEMAHEIRNPLGGIKGFASLLERDLKEHPELKKMASYIVEGTDELNALVSHVLDYARPVEPHFTSTSLKELIEEVVRLVELDHSLQPKPHFKIKLTPEKLKASVDPHMLKGALLNLTVNSIQAMPQGGEILFKGALEKNQLILEIQDTGPGIPKEDREQIFSPFFTTKTEGNGFGLTEVHKVVHAHGGQIDLIVSKKRGAHFKMTLPQKV